MCMPEKKKLETYNSPSLVLICGTPDRIFARSSTNVYALPNPIQIYWVSLLPSTFVQDLII